ncbi:hypothetical protein SELMODRAFT_406152 [Selaginella moellendorffii]|uniref:Uncharacterized protein n=1 Tax=Selaginella moellendorffii TaxID=88036 RepID=D8R1F6_SELML|nr:hypothetical protein SELMODRAFT_406152 [Selaginella moellendorffii]
MGDTPLKRIVSNGSTQEQGHRDSFRENQAMPSLRPTPFGILTSAFPQPSPFRPSVFLARCRTWVFAACLFCLKAGTYSETQSSAWNLPGNSSLVNPTAKQLGLENTLVSLA